ncbi:MAG TPA: TraR/DksA family transcriptional regulator [Methylophaga aminisulfidivorans]|uniref:TraR/DksA family transcriptional regulator n=2 Tax=root TaxID=1 RepID=A0A7C2A9W9_9GAMM|nr:TraR/DksA family transcriptional regulator [Methylophaga aminisulfidivorans]
MSDEVDVANEVAERNLNMALQAAKGVKRERSDDCIECGIKIPYARQHVTGGTCICAPCLHIQEQRAKQIRGSGW